MHSELSYGLSFAPKLQRVLGIDLSGSHQPTPLTRALAANPMFVAEASAAAPASASNYDAEEPADDVMTHE